MKFIKFIPLVCGYILILFILHMIPIGAAINKIGIFRADYFVHTLLFLPWMGLAWGNRSLKKRVPGIIIWLTTGIVLATGMEILHYWLPYRAFNPMDLFFNVGGVIAGSLIFLVKP